jgi:hypothetical protein
MSPESQLEAAVFFVASKVIDPDLRAQFLDQACAEDARLDDYQKFRWPPKLIGTSHKIG